MENQKQCTRNLGVKHYFLFVEKEKDFSYFSKKHMNKFLKKFRFEINSFQSSTKDENYKIWMPLYIEQDVTLFFEKKGYVKQFYNLEIIFEL